MTASIVNIESLDENNKSFGTGFIIDTDEKGVYILTCKHVIDHVKTPVVEKIKAQIIATNDLIDMAVLYVSKLQKIAFPLQIDSCKKLNVEVIGFSRFNKNLNQKKHIQAILYKEYIELHSNTDDSFYTVRKIKAKNGYQFDRGNSGSPVICKESSKVIAMISNKEGSDISYAIDISFLEEIWKEIPKKLLKKQKENRKRKYSTYFLITFIIFSLGSYIYKSMYHSFVPSPSHWNPLIYKDKRSYSKNSTHTVKDNYTGFIWQKSNSSNIMNWSDAKKYCSNLSLDGYTDWKLPTEKQLFFLADRTKVHPAIDKKYFNIKNKWYWSATTHEKYKSASWIIYFNYGSDGWHDKNSYKGYALCVR